MYRLDSKKWSQRESAKVTVSLLKKVEIYRGKKYMILHIFLEDYISCNYLLIESFHE